MDKPVNFTLKKHGQAVHKFQGKNEPPETKITAVDESAAYPVLSTGIRITYPQM